MVNSLNQMNRGRFVERDAKAYSNYTTVVQSSGTGKLRTAVVLDSLGVFQSYQDHTAAWRVYMHKGDYREALCAEAIRISEVTPIASYDDLVRSVRDI